MNFIKNIFYKYFIKNKQKENDCENINETIIPINNKLNKLQKGLDEKIKIIEGYNSLKINGNLTSEYIKNLIGLYKATPDVYCKWLRGYIENGGKITHLYDYYFSNSDFYIAKNNITIYDWYGSRSMHIIVPKGVNVNIKGLGHNTLYLMDGYKQYGNWIPVYLDECFLKDDVIRKEIIKIIKMELTEIINIINNYRYSSNFIIKDMIQECQNYINKLKKYLTKEELNDLLNELDKILENIYL